MFFGVFSYFKQTTPVRWLDKRDGHYGKIPWPTGSNEAGVLECSPLARCATRLHESHVSSGLSACGLHVLVT